MGIVPIYRCTAVHLLKQAEVYQGRKLKLPRVGESVFLKTGAKLQRDNRGFVISYYAMDGGDCRRLFKEDQWTISKNSVK